MGCGNIDLFLTSKVKIVNRNGQAPPSVLSEHLCHIVCKSSFAAALDDNQSIFAGF